MGIGNNFHYLVPSSGKFEPACAYLPLRSNHMADQPSLPGFEQTSREQRLADMDEEILDVNRAAKILGVSSRTVYNMARQGKIPAMRVGREWRFARKTLIDWVSKSSENEQLAVVLRNGKIRGRRS
jgi:excisionase family DNA binding protein